MVLHISLDMSIMGLIFLLQKGVDNRIEACKHLSHSWGCQNSFLLLQTVAKEHVAIWSFSTFISFYWNCSDRNDSWLLNFTAAFHLLLFIIASGRRPSNGGNLFDRIESNEYILMAPSPLHVYPSVASRRVVALDDKCSSFLVSQFKCVVVCGCCNNRCSSRLTNSAAWLLIKWS